MIPAPHLRTHRPNECFQAPFPRLWPGWVIGISLLCIAWLAPSAAPAADVVFMSNGDRLSGKVLRGSGDELRLETPYAGIVEIDWEEIVQVQLEEPGKVLLEDGAVVETRSLRKPRPSPGAVGHPAGKVPTDSVQQIHPEPWELGIAGKFSGQVNLSAEFENGSSNTDEIDLDFELRYRRHEHRVDVFGQLEYDRTNGNMTKRNWFLIPKYDHFLNDQWYLSAMYGAQQRKLEGLDLQQFGGPSLGY